MRSHSSSRARFATEQHVSGKLCLLSHDCWRSGTGSMLHGPGTWSTSMSDTCPDTVCRPYNRIHNKAGQSELSKVEWIRYDHRWVIFAVCALVGRLRLQRQSKANLSDAASRGDIARRDVLYAQNDSPAFELIRAFCGVYCTGACWTGTTNHALLQLSPVCPEYCGLSVCRVRCVLAATIRLSSVGAVIRSLRLRTMSCQT